MAKLFITDHADPPVGAFSQTWDVECPLEKDAEFEEIEFFRNAMIEAFNEFAFGKVTAEYDFERAAIAEQEELIYNA